MAMEKSSNQKYLMILLCINFFLLGCQRNFFEQELTRILGVEKVEITNIERLDEWSGMQGDGYILEIYELSNETIQLFLNGSKELPEKSSFKRLGWDKSPVDSSYNEIMVLGLKYFSENQELKKQLIEIKQLLNQNDVYYSFYYQPNKDNPNNVQIFILDTDNKRLYAIDQQL